MNSAESGRLSFKVCYDDERGGTVTVTVRTGYPNLGPEVDHQVVTIENTLLPFRCEAEVGDGLIRRLEFTTPGLPPRGLEQKHIRTSGLVALVHQWAGIGRELQMSGRPQDAQLMLELPHKPNVQEAVDATRAAMRGWLPADSGRSRGRATGRESEELLLRVVSRYRELVRAGHRSPRKVIAAEESYTSEHIGRLLVKARKRGLLDQAKPGRAGEYTEQQVHEDVEAWF